MYCKNCKYCYPMKMEYGGLEKKYTCIYNTEAFTDPPFMAPTIPSVDVCNCKHFKERDQSKKELYGER